ncbi:MAG: hypothetical protein CMJ44_01935 [Pimelobacter sp.]|nr:hypothetical protein [Pimelobacter sp.]
MHATSDADSSPAAPADQCLQLVASIETVVAIALRAAGQMRRGPALGALDQELPVVKEILRPDAVRSSGRARTGWHSA